MDERAETNPWDKLEDRAPRVMETREQEQTVPAWRPASQLPDPHPRDGWVHRWVMVMALGKEEATHFSKMRREGWEPCQLGDYPELSLDLSRNESFYARTGLIEVGGLVLCRLPTEGADIRRAHYSKRSKDQVRNSTNELLSHQHSETKMGTFVEQNRTRISFGQGTSKAP